MPRDRSDKYRRLSHVTYDCRYHFIWVTKYRFKIFDKKIEVALKWAIKNVCDSKDIEILEGAVGREHVHLYLSVPPKYSMSDTMKWIKGKSAEQLFKQFPELNKMYWGRHLWARGYFVSTIGITDNIIREYIQQQRKVEIDDFNGIWRKARQDEVRTPDTTDEIGGG